MKTLRLLLVAICLLASHQQGMSQTIPNDDFELWNSKTRDEPDSGWVTSNNQSIEQHDTLTVWKVPGISGQAIHIQTAIVGTDTMYAYATNSNNLGAPYTGQPAAITGYYRYNLPGLDSAILYVEFYKAGSVIATNIFPIKGTGSLSTFTFFSLPLASMSLVPDTVFIAVTSSNVMTGIGVEPASWIELDQLAFTGTTDTIIAGGSFDSWSPVTLDKLPGWITFFGFGPSGVSKSTTHYWGNYSAKLQTQVDASGTIPAIMLNGSNNTFGTPYTEMNDTLTGYYMYSQTGGDTASVQAILQSAGSPVGGTGVLLTDASTWTYFEVPLNASTTPDTLQIFILSSQGNPGVTSTMYVDHLRLKSQTASVPVPFAAANSLLAYPNPAVTDLYIKMLKGQGAAATITIYDASGRLAGQWNYNNVPATVSVPVASLTSGVYVYEVQASGNVYKGNFVKK